MEEIVEYTIVILSFTVAAFVLSSGLALRSYINSKKHPEPRQISDAEANALYVAISENIKKLVYKILVEQYKFSPLNDKTDKLVDVKVIGDDDN